MPLSKRQVQEIAHLARLNLTDKETEKFASELAVIVDYFEQLKTIDTSSVQPRDQFIKAENVFREDEVKPSLSQEEALKNAPDTDGEFFHVPKVIG